MADTAVAPDNATESFTACGGSKTEPVGAAVETDIDAADVGLPGSDHLEFNRGVTDLDAVGSESPGLPRTTVCWAPTANSRTKEPQVEGRLCGGYAGS